MTHAGEIGPYRLVRELGRGGMGVVWLAEHQASRAHVALKLLPRTDAAALLRFQREAEALARVRHPGVLSVHGAGRTDDGRAWIASDLIEGRDLRTEVGVRGPLPPLEAAALVWRLADALSAVHAAGLVHRDLKPDNVILRPDGTPVLIDFGLVRDLERSRITESGQLMGTPTFMPPEQAEGLPVDSRGDVYALAATLGFLVTGRLPFSGAHVMEVLSRVLRGVPEWPSPLHPDAPPALEELVRRAMAQDPVQRPADGAALRDALDAVLAPDPRVARVGVSRLGRALLAGALVVSPAIVAAVSLARREELAEPAVAAPSTRATPRSPDPPPPSPAPPLVQRVLGAVPLGEREGRFLGRWILILDPAGRAAAQLCPFDPDTGAAGEPQPWSERVLDAALEPAGDRFLVVVVGESGLSLERRTVSSLPRSTPSEATRKLAGATRARLSVRSDPSGRSFAVVALELAPPFAQPGRRTEMHCFELDALLRPVGHNYLPDPVREVAFAPDGMAWMLMGPRGLESLQGWEPGSLAELERPGPPLVGLEWIAVRGNGELLLASPGQPTVWQVPRHGASTPLPGRGLPSNEIGVVRSLSGLPRGLCLLRRGGRELALAGTCGEVGRSELRAWDLSAEAPSEAPSVELDVAGWRGLAGSPDGRRLLLYGRAVHLVDLDRLHGLQ